MIRGIGTSNGIGMGRVLIVCDEQMEIEHKKIVDIEKEQARFHKAKSQFIADTEKMVSDLKKRLGNADTTALVLQNQIYLIKDIEMNESILHLITEKHLCVEAAVEQTCQMYATVFAQSDSEALKQRIADIKDLQKRLLHLLLGREQQDLSHLPPNTILVAEELQPSMTANMDMEHVAGLIAEKGGETSHMAILARALEIPAVLRVKDILQKVQDDDFVIVDGAYGEVFVQPDSKTIAIYEKKRQNYLINQQELKKYVDKDTRTADDKKVCLAANIGNADDAAKAMKAGAEAIGLFRTEFLFMNGDSMPTEEEQFACYKKAAVICRDKILTIRTLDIGGDKDIPYMGLTKESNPFLGYRAIRFCLGRVDMFTKQLRAILRASAFGNIRMMLPLVTDVGELRCVREMVAHIMRDLDAKNIAYDKNIPIGVMIETPAACMIADVLAKEADFFSIGTNDLTQYTIAVDRGNEHVAYLYSTFHPAVLRLIRQVIACAHKEQVEVGMCGEAAANPMMIPLLLDFGLDEFSVAPGMVLETRKNIARWTQKEAHAITEQVMQMGTEKEIHTYLSGLF